MIEVVNKYLEVFLKKGLTIKRNVQNNWLNSNLMNDLYKNIIYIFIVSFFTFLKKILKFSLLIKIYKFLFISLAPKINFSKSKNKIQIFEKKKMLSYYP
jgi:hypothetical protein